MGAFEDFVNTELPLRTNVAALPTASRYARFTGVGRAVEERTPAQVLADIAAAAASHVHDQYLLADGTRALTADWAAGVYKITTQSFQINPTAVAVADVFRIFVANAADDIITARTIYRRHTAAAGGAGLGVRELCKLENAAGDYHDAAKLEIAWDDPTDTSEDAYQTFSVMVAGALVELLKLSAAGVDVKTHKILNVVDPTADQGAATKKYVDDSAYSHPNHSGDVTSVADGATTLIAKLRTRSFLVEVPTPADDDEFIVHWFPVACTLTQVRVHVKAATSTTFELTERGYDTPDAGGTDISAAAITATTTPADVTMNNTGMAANSVLVYHSSAVVGTPGKVWIFGKYTVD